MLRLALSAAAMLALASGASVLVLEEASGRVNARDVLAAAANGTGNGNVFSAQLQLQSYNNPGGNLPMVQGYNVSCLNSKLKPNPGQCNFVFVTTLTVLGGKIVMINDPNTYSTANGQVSFASSSVWGSLVGPVQFPTKPESLVVTVMHTGNVYPMPVSPISQLTSNMVVVDTFTADMAGVLPLTNAFAQNSGYTTLNLQGQRSTLQMRFSLRCLNNGVGPDCNLFCNAPKTASLPAQCTLKMNGVTDPNIVCQQTLSSPLKNMTVDSHQYYPCKNCPFGVTKAANGAASCVASATPGNCPTATPLGGVDPSFKTATTALAICFVISALIVIGLAVRMYMTKKKADEAEYVRRRNAWSERPNVELSSKDNKAYNHKPDPDASYSETNTSDSASDASSVTGSHVSGSHTNGSVKSGSVAVGAVPPADPEAHHDSRHSSRRPSEAPSHDAASHHSHPRAGSQSSGEHGRTTPRIEARV